MGRPPKFSDEQKEFIYETSEGKMTIINKVSSRNIALNFKNKFNETISKSFVNNFLLTRLIFFKFLIVHFLLFYLNIIIIIYYIMELYKHYCI